MLKLPRVTLLGIDCFRPDRTIHIMRYSMAWAKFARVVLLTDTMRHAQRLKQLRTDGIEIVHITQGDQKVAPYPGHPPIALHYERDILTLPVRYSETGFVHVAEWDSCVLNPNAWTDEFLEYDFIGARWPVHTDPGFEPCDGETNSTGNGGFCLRSRKFNELVAQAYVLFKDDPAHAKKIISSDRWMCRTIRGWLQERGVRFADNRIADMFSVENRVFPGNCWGMHGKGTFALNNLGGPFAHIR